MSREGALSAIGDTHAAQGMGEVSGTAVGTPMRIVFEISVVKAMSPIPSQGGSQPAGRTAALARNLYRTWLKEVAMLRCVTVVLVVAGLLWPVSASTQVAVIGSEIEQLLGVRVDARGLAFQVRSNGCTQKADFEVQIFESRPLQLLLVRLRPDRCEALVPHGTWIRFSYQELGLRNGRKICISNPLATIRVVREES